MNGWRAYWKLGTDESKAIDAAIIGLGFALIEHHLSQARYPESVKRALLDRLSRLREDMT